MRHTYYGGGKVVVLGSAKQFRRLYFYHKYDRYSTGRFRGKDIAYLKSAALKGKLEKIVIEKVYLKNTTKTLHKNVNFYEDKLNTLYREDELLTLKEAENIIAQSTTEFNFMPKTQKSTQPIIKRFAGDVDVGTIWASRYYAQRGDLVKFAVRRNLNDLMIEDTTGGLYRKDDLITVNQAKSIALAYWQDRRQRLVDHINDINHDVP